MNQSDRPLLDTGNKDRSAFETERQGRAKLWGKVHVDFNMM